MTLSKKNWFARYYNLVYGAYPKDVCSFFWGALIIVLLSPVMLIGGFVSERADEYREWNSMIKNFLICLFWGFLVYLVYFIILIVGVSFYGDHFLGIEKLNLPEVYKQVGPTMLFLVIPLYGILVFLLMALGIAAVVGIGWCIHYIHKAVQNKIRENRKVENIEENSYLQNTKDFVGAIRGKYCTKITWKE